jgi:hypothetical protein
MLTRRTPRTGRERGAALLMTVLLLVIGAMSASLTFFRPSANGEIQQDRTADTLAAVKQALIGYAAQRGVAVCSNPGNAAQCSAELAARPGELPCPDTNGDGFAEDDDRNTGGKKACGNAAGATDRLGRVPWRTLGIPEPHDSAGETLWYAVSLPFLGIPSNPIVGKTPGPASGRINSSTVGDLIVRGVTRRNPDIVSTLTSQAVAVLFAPGVVLSGQNRSSTTIAACPGKPNMARNLCPANYLDTTAGLSNSIVSGPYITGSPDGDYNDRLIYISTSDLMPVVENRVGKELIALLNAYRQGSKCRCYPWADSWQYSGGIPDIGVNRGRFPATDVTPVNWGVKNVDNDIPPLPKWVADNDWNNVVFYSAALQETDEAGRRCFFCSPSPTLIVRFDPSGALSENVSALVLIPGTPAKNVDRPSQVWTPLTSAEQTKADAMSAYFEDALNKNKGGCPGWNAEYGDSPPFGTGFATVSADCDTYVRPQGRTYDRDRLFTVQTKPQSHCETAARALLAIMPCKDLLNIGLCLKLHLALQSCPDCKLAADAAIVVPCLNTLTPLVHCGAPMDTLKICGKL